MAEDYYQLLGVDRQASAEEIKRAFRAKAHQHHPDKATGDTEAFKRINEAYQVLSDPAKRRQYDQFGTTFDQAGRGGFGGFQDFGGSQWSNVNVDFGDFGDLFGDLFGLGGSRRTRPSAARGQDIEAQVTISFRQAIFGGQETIELKHHRPCARCGGVGAEPGTGRQTCSTCQGTGQVQQAQRTFLGTFQSVATCPTCQGEGRVVGTPCRTCRGDGRQLKTERLNVKIPAGIRRGQRIRLAGQGEAGRRGVTAGDLYLVVEVEPDREFERQDDDILSTIEIPISTATLGGAVEVKTIDGPVSWKIPAGTPSGKAFNIRGHGVPHLRGSGRGDHRVTVNVRIPGKLSTRAKKLFRELADEGV
ncbi:MAG: molecular chaperone DnaJ [Candidatus Kerfeldbacteria bacterium]|nr:molecular chaperone DnaJ [Candidatus Kerfeldbacteria bacterium]